MNDNRCECEHQDCKHPYATKVEGELTKVLYGLMVCKECYETCMAEYHLDASPIVSRTTVSDYYAFLNYTFWTEIIRLFQWFGDRAWHEQKQKLPPGTKRPKFAEITIRDDGIVEVELGEDFEGYTREA